MSELSSSRHSTSGKRLLELDALRGVAATSVVVYHYTQFLHDLFGFSGPAVFSSKLLAWAYPFRAGEYGVSLFFVISGFVILMTLRRTERSLDFVVSRFARLFPAFWCGVTATALVRVLLRGDVLGWSTYFANLTMLPEVFGRDFVDGVYWTLLVELQFYALLFAAWRLRWLSRIEWVSALWLGLLIACQVGAKIAPLHRVSEILTTALILKHIPLFTAGMMYYRIHEDGVTRSRSAIIAAALAATWLSGNVTKAIVVTLSFAALTLLVTGRLRRLSASKPWLWLGDRSYAIYLVHMTIGLVLMQKLVAHTRDPLVVALVPAACTFALAAAIHRYIEAPALRGIREWYRGRRAPSRAAGAAIDAA